MNRKGRIKKRLLLWVLSGIAVFSGHDSFAGAGFTVEKIPTPGVSVTHAYAGVRGEHLKVAGRVSRLHKVHVRGHVDVFVYNAKGALLGASRNRLPGIMSRRKGLMNFFFSSDFDFIPPEGATIEVRYHGQFFCSLI